jgi:hypothetical protein
MVGKRSNGTGFRPDTSGPARAIEEAAPGDRWPEALVRGRCERKIVECRAFGITCWETTCTRWDGPGSAFSRPRFGDSGPEPDNQNLHQNLNT